MSDLPRNGRSGVVAVIAGATGWDRARASAVARSAFDAPAASPELFSDGPLTLAWDAAPGRAVHVDETAVCLIEGALYALGDVHHRNAAGTQVPRLLAESFKQRGTSALAGLRGDFWVLFWERGKREGFVAADHLGGRTPYWTNCGGNLLIASEVRDLCAALPSRPDPDPVALAHWLTMTTAAGGPTLFKGVHRLDAAHWLGIGTRMGMPRRFWSPRYRTPDRILREQAVAEIRSRLALAVDRRLEGAAHAGIRLSGGIDSSAVAAFAANREGAGRSLHAYSATFPDHPTMDESQLIDSTVKALGLGSTRIVVRGGSVIAGALPYLHTWQLPPASPNLYFWIPLLARAAEDGTDVLLDGEGGDETFSLSPYLLADRLRRGRLLSAVALTQRIPSRVRRDSPARVWRLLRRFGLKGAMPPAAHLAVRRLAGSGRYAAPWLPPRLAEEWLASEESAFSWKRLAGPRWWSHLVETITRGLGPALVYEQVRRLTGQVGLEARHPLVDVDVVERVLSLPPELAFDPRINRPLLRDAVAGMLPDEVRLRPHKSNFDSLFHGLMAGPELPLIRRLLSPDVAELSRYIDVSVVYRELLSKDPPSRPHPLMEWAVQVWRMVTAECWLRTQSDPGFPERMLDQGRLSTGDHELVSLA